MTQGGGLPGQTIDLTRQVPPGWSVSGLSEAESDGVNLFLRPTAPESRLLFTTDRPRLILFRYQLSSGASDVRAEVRLNGEKLGERTFTRGTFGAAEEVGGFSSAGQNTLSVRYTCVQEGCLPSVQQYGTGVRLTDPPSLTAREDGSVGTELWWLDAPQSLLTVSGTSPLRHDGVHTYRQIQEKSFRLGWSQDARVFNATFTVYGSGPFEVRALVGGKTVYSARGDAKVQLSPTVSLVPFSGARALDVKVECLQTQGPCASLYFARLTVMTRPSTPLPLQWGLGAGLGLLLLALFARLLGLWGPRQSHAASG